MRRTLALLLAATMLFTLSACDSTAAVSTSVSASDSTAAESEASSAPTEVSAQSTPADETTETTAEPDAEATADSDAESGSNILVVYFSRVGVTPFVPENVDAVASASINIRDDELVGNMQYLAEYITDYTGGDMYQIITEKEYPTDYRETTNLASEEQSADERPALTSHVDNMEQYDVIFLGYPNWWGTLPQAVMTFLEEYDFSGKTIVPFCSHGGSALGRGPQDIAALCPDATLLDGFAVGGSNVTTAQADVESWIDGLGL